jgi:hypothetical protein
MRLYKELSCESDTGTVPATTWPAATRNPTLTVETTSAAGTAADALSVSAVASAPPDTANPCRASRLASSRRAVVSRLERVPSGMANWRASSSRAKAAVWRARGEKGSVFMTYSERQEGRPRTNLSLFISAATVGTTRRRRKARAGPLRRCRRPVP